MKTEFTTCTTNTLTWSICFDAPKEVVTKPEIPHLSYGDFFDKICELKESGYSELEY